MKNETKAKKCRNASPRLLDRIVMRAVYSHDLHNWKQYRRQNRRQNRHVIYYCRQCECGAHEVKNAGPMGDGKWRDVNSPFRLQWEKDSFDRAEILDA